jgi:dihydroorotase
MAKSPIRRSTCSTARRCSSTACCAAAARFPKLKRGVRAHHDQGRPRFRGRRRQRRGTITAHHLLLQPQRHLPGGIRPHYYCLPVLKRETHREALVAAAISGNPKFFLGTDSAPHAQSTKEAACGCAGCYTAHAGIELYAEAFDAGRRAGRLEAFASFMARISTACRATKGELVGVFREEAGKLVFVAAQQPK